MSTFGTESTSGDVEATKKCQRCGRDVSRSKAGLISFKNRSMTFCENCFKSVFKYDESLLTVAQIYEKNHRRTPFTIRSNNWHRSSYMIVNEIKTLTGKNGVEKQVYVGDFYLRGVLKEQGHTVGKANHFIWNAWSAEEAAKYREVQPDSNERNQGDVAEM